MSDREFEIGTRKFQLNKIDVFKQFHIVRRIAPILGDIIPIAQKLSSLPESQQGEAGAEIIAPIMNGMSKLSDSDANMVFLGLLSAVEIRQESSNSWARIVRGDVFMIQDLELPLLLQIAGRAFQYNLAGFFGSLPQASHGPK